MNVYITVADSKGRVIHVDSAPGLLESDLIPSSATKPTLATIAAALTKYVTSKTVTPLKK